MAMVDLYKNRVVYTVVYRSNMKKSQLHTDKKVPGLGGCCWGDLLDMH